MALEKVRAAMAAQGLEAMLISRAENMRYVSGFTGGDGHVLVTGTGAWLATDSRYYEQVGREAPGLELVRMADGFAKALPELVSKVGIERLGFESDFVTYDQYASWGEAVPGLTWVPVKELVLGLRATKGEAELAAIRKAVAIADAAMAQLLEEIRPGMTEKEAAWVLESYMRTHGADALSFDIIVGSGPNGAMPHAVTSDRAIQAGEPIVVDMGCKVDGYCSDMTRTFCLGKPQDLNAYLRVWNTVLEAHNQARDAIRPGMMGKEAHAVAQAVIDQAGYGAHFGHGLGHGVGLAIHEKPSVGRLSEDVLEPGAVITVEPGIYLEGWGGVRLEDMGVVTESGIEIFTSSPKIAIVS